MASIRLWLAGSLGLGALVFGACVGDDSSTNGDGGNPPADATTGGDGSATDASDASVGPCNLAAPFQTPVQVAGLPNPINSVVRLSPDELTAYFAMQVVDDGGPFALYQATRPSLTGAFGAPVALDALNDDAGESDPAVSTDGHDIVYVRSYGPPVPASQRDLWHASRSTLDASFANPAKITGNVNSDVQDDYVSLEANDDLWFVSTRDAGGDHVIFHAVTAGGISYSSVSAAANINAPGSDQYYPVVTSDGLRIYYLRAQLLFTATRASTSADFSSPTAVSELNVAFTDFRPAWVSPDGCRLYLTVGSPQTAYVASKPAN